jgi:hypothetical protein
MKYKNNKYTLSTGRRLYSNNGVLGLYPKEICAPDENRLTQGLDGEIFEGTPGPSNPDRLNLTLAERSEIAEWMIGQWAEWGRIGFAMPPHRF